MVDNDSQNCSWNDEKLYSEVVNVTADGALVLDQGQVNVGDATGNEEDLDTSLWLPWIRILIQSSLKDKKIQVFH